MVLNVIDLAISRGGIPVLEGVTFSLSPGEALVLQGPNGAGKTTLLRSIAGLQSPLFGEIAVAPESIAYAGHSDGVKTGLSVLENLKFWAEVFEAKDIGAALEGFGLVALADRPAGALSAGQRRRLGLARLLVTGRPLWVLDEPTVSLDAAAVAMFVTVVRNHLARGGAALIATHVDLGLSEARVFDVAPYRARRSRTDQFDEAFL